jgi:hypothetical protein
MPVYGQVANGGAEEEAEVKVETGQVEEAVAGFALGPETNYPPPKIYIAAKKGVEEMKVEKVRPVTLSQFSCSSNPDCNNSRSLWMCKSMLPRPS